MRRQTASIKTKRNVIVLQNVTCMASERQQTLALRVYSVHSACFVNVPIASYCKIADTYHPPMHDITCEEATPGSTELLSKAILMSLFTSLKSQI